MPIYLKITKVLAILIILYGLLNLAIGFAVATGFLVEPEPGRYLGSRSSGEMIDDGIYRVIFGILMGAIYEIGRGVYAKDSTS